MNICILIGDFFHLNSYIMTLKKSYTPFVHAFRAESINRYTEIGQQFLSDPIST